jgi:hypothetical protein
MANDYVALVPWCFDMLVVSFPLPRFDLVCTIGQEDGNPSQFQGRDVKRHFGHFVQTMFANDAL